MEEELPLKDTYERNVFVMLRYRDYDTLEKLREVISRSLRKHGLFARFADVEQDEKLLWSSVEKCMDYCKYGIAVFDALNPKNDGEFSPNVIHELGYMMGQNKECLILKDKSIKMYADLSGHMVKPFVSLRIDDDIEEGVSQWAAQMTGVRALFRTFAALLPESKFKERLERQPEEKFAIGRYLVEHYLRTNLRSNKIKLDSGTTTIAIAECLYNNRESYKFLKISTNNLLATLLLSSVSDFECELVRGIVDEDFAAVFGEEAVKGLIESSSGTSIIACTDFTAEQGPYANSDENLSVKRALFESSENVIIVADSEKLHLPASVPDKSKPVFESKKEWNEILAEKVEAVLVYPELKKKESFKHAASLLKEKLLVVPAENFDSDRTAEKEAPINS